jgi:hypothetical protein
VAWRPDRNIVLLGVLFCLAAAAFDVAEIAHQIANSDTGLIALAALVGVTHLGAATVGLGLRGAL